MIERYQQTIDTAIEQCLNQHIHPRELYQPIQYLFDGGGKRVRPILTILSCNIVGGSAEHAIPAAVAVELLHNFTLVHDDIMDRSPMRRGRKTVHEQFDVNTAILSGDVMIGLALEQIAQSAGFAHDPLRVMKAFSTGLIEVCEGQSLDVSLTTGTEVTVAEYFTMIEKKTARLLEMSVAIGAIVGGATEDQLQHLTTFAREIGIAFQLQDDLLDLYGSEQFGKAPGGDLIEGKRTWFVLQLRNKLQTSGEHLHTNHRALLEEFFDRDGLKPTKVQPMVAAMEELGIVAEAEAEIRRITDDAFYHLRQLPESTYRDEMEGLAQKLMVRTH